MSKQKLDRSQVARLLVDLRRFRPAQRMCPVGGAIEPDARNPGMDDPRILSGRQVRLSSKAAREQMLSVPPSMLGSQSRIDARVCSVISNWTGRPVLLLDHGGPGCRCKRHPSPFRTLPIAEVIAER